MALPPLLMIELESGLTADDDGALVASFM